MALSVIWDESETLDDIETDNKVHDAYFSTWIGVQATLLTITSNMALEILIFNMKFDFTKSFPNT